MLIHQEAYKHLPTFILKQDEEFRNLRSFGTDGENSLQRVFQKYAQVLLNSDVLFILKTI